MPLEAVDPTEFVEIASSALSRGGTEELARRISVRWTPRQVCPVLTHDDPDVRKLACVVLALCGDGRITGSLTRALRDGNAQVAQMAEQALWSVWFRSGSLDARRQFCKGLNALKDNDPARAIPLFAQAQKLDPQFAEAYNQCGTAYYLQEQWAESMEQCEKALNLNSTHFGAMSGLGHGHFQLGNFAEASRWYRRALAINPHMDSVASALARIESCVAAV